MGWEIVKEDPKPGKWEVVHDETVREPLNNEVDDRNVLEKGLSAAANVVAPVGQFIDKYTGAPTRSAVHELQKDWTNVGGAAEAFGKQFGANPNAAPTGKDIARYAGVPETPLSEVLPWAYSDTGEGIQLKKGGMLDPTASGAVGLGVDMAADPTNLIPGKAITSAAKTLSGVTKPALGKALSKFGQTMTGIPQQELLTYAKNLPEINKNISRFGPDIASAAEGVQSKFASAIRNTRTQMNELITGNVAKLGEKSVDIAPAITKMESLRASLNPVTHADEISQIDEMISSISKLYDTPGSTSLRNAMDVKEFLQDRAKGAYMKSGQMFQPGKRSQQIAKQGAAEIRKLINQSAPEIAEANNKLSLLHSLEDKMNKGLYSPGKPYEALMSAGAGTNPRNVKQLEALGNITGVNMVEDAQKLAAQRRFTNPEWLPVDSTGKSWTRMAVGGTLGHLTGLPFGGAAGLAATSPAATKAAINAGSMASKIAPDITRGRYLGAEAIGRQQNTGIGAMKPGSKEHVLQKTANSKYGQILSSAQSERGDVGFASTYYLLQQSDPEFRRLVEDNEGE